MKDWEEAVRIVFPSALEGCDLSILPLYALDWSVPLQKRELFDPAFAARPFSPSSLPAFRSLPRPLPPTFDGFFVEGRRKISVKEGKAVSLCSYFNAFPAGFWARFTDVKSVRLSFKAQGEGTVEVWRSDAHGREKREWASTFEGEKDFSPSFSISSMAEGGYLWLDLHASLPSSLDSASWQVPSSKKEGGQDVCLTTFNSPLSASMAISSVKGKEVKKVFCVDQGSVCALKDPAFVRASRSLPGFNYIKQENFGGSGGFARGMFEALEGEDPFFVLMDDDARLEEESLDRLSVFQKHCLSPAIVGAGMFHTDSPSSLFTFGEALDLKKLWYFSSLDLGYNHDFAALPLRDSPRLHRRCSEDYQGWWLCSIPRSVVQKIGLPLPVFIKFDDIEYGLRAKEASIPSLCLPGTAVWHPAWHLKDQTRSWVEYFAERNRFLTGLLYKPDASGVFKASLRDQSNLGLRMEYASMVLKNMALKDLLSGPGFLFKNQEEKKKRAERIRLLTDAPALPPSSLPLPAVQTPDPEAVCRMKRALKAGMGLFFCSVGSAAQEPQREVSSTDSWLSLACCSHAQVYDQKGLVKTVKKNAPLFRRLYKENLILTAELVKRWSDLSKAYRKADMGSVESWKAIFRL
ncbi:MAG: glycosyltransferase [Aeriscardovia sp.]|nr:glycosyltransferase [Aeriscardovia sp.]